MNNKRVILKKLKVTHMEKRFASVRFNCEGKLCNKDEVLTYI